MNIDYYRVSVKSDMENYTHDIINKKHRNAIILEAQIGKPAWFCYQVVEDIGNPWHRVCTSRVKDIKERTLGINGIPVTTVTIVTENSIYEFER